MIVMQQGANRTSLSNGATIQMSAARIGGDLTGTFVFTYRGQTTANVSGLELIGTADFALLDLPTLPVQLSSGQSLSVRVKFTASSGDRVTTVLLIAYNENGTGPNATMGLNLVGSAPDLALAYFLQTDQNVAPLAPGATLLFPDVPTGTTALAVVVVSNRGGAAGGVQSIAVEGNDFQGVGLPLLPGTLAAGAEFRFTIRYSPKQNGTSTGKLTIGLPDRTVEVGIQGIAVGPIYSYELVEDEVSSPLSPSQPFLLGETAAGTVRDFVVIVKNTGTADGVIAAINLLGPGFSLTDAPFLPVTLKAGSSLFFGFRYAPVQSGNAIGRMRVGNDNFELRSTVPGGKVTFSYTLNDKTFAIAPNGTMALNPLAVGLKTQFSFRIANEGAVAATVSSVGLNGAGFTFGDLPSFPASIAPGSNVVIPIVFAPATLGAASAVLRVDGNQFTISATGTAPPPLPAVRFEGVSGLLKPLDQPAVGLSLEGPYPFSVRGVLTMTVDWDGGTDTAVQFTTGGRTVAFTIPANATKAVFPNDLDQVRISSGTLAGSIILSATFATTNNIDITPEVPPRIALAVPPSAPRLLDMQITSRTTNGITLALTGFATTRSLATLNLQFSAMPGYRFPADKLTVDLSGPAAVWFQNGASQGFGGLFTAAVVITTPTVIQNGAQSLADVIQSISATVSNAQGSSDPIALKAQ